MYKFDINRQQDICLLKVGDIFYKGHRYDWLYCLSFGLIEIRQKWVITEKNNNTWIAYKAYFGDKEASND
tara:strand:- start:28 stop:237 length:210 start_codon:yes stop_codon:yes gene_type:complete